MRGAGRAAPVSVSPPPMMTADSGTHGPWDALPPRAATGAAARRGAPLDVVSPLLRRPCSPAPAPPAPPRRARATPLPAALALAADVDQLRAELRVVKEQME
eukprot:gene48633-59360_t